MILIAHSPTDKKGGGQWKNQGYMIKACTAKFLKMDNSHYLETENPYMLL